MQTHFGDFAGELNTSSTLSMKGGNSGTNEFDPDKDNILKSTFDTLTEEGLKALEDYYANFKEIFLSRCQVTRQGTIL
jgi:Holliday junction resolvase RusA-like endonuclease